MLKQIVKTIIGGAIGGLALCAVAKVAFEAGKEVQRVTDEYERMAEKTETKAPETRDIPESGEPKKRAGKLGMALGFLKGGSVVGDLAKHPENHKLEACIEGDEIQIRVKKKE